jgi:uncharacterized metal-binding protein YceD (DUF177 family)
MTQQDAAPLSRLVSVYDLPAEGTEVVVETTPEEREALAREFKLPALQALTATLHLSGTPRRVHVTGRVEARVTQVCVVTLDPFDSDVQEAVEVDFAVPGTGAQKHGEDPPDEIVNGKIDLGALTAEFFALSLDPYPRKPGVDFTFETPDDRAESPFAALSKRKADK